jgi:hypothetical protein
MQSALCRVVLAAVFTTAAGAAQNAQDPITKIVPIRVVGHDDDMPRPGVDVYLLNGEAVQIDGDGFLIAEDQSVRRLRHAQTVRTDPEGRAQLTSARQLRGWHLNIAEPFVRAEQPKLVDDVWVIRVSENSPIGVRVVDADNKPVVGFPVALHAANRDMAVAITDKTGRAMLGISKDFKARAVICPAGWIGSRDGFPTVADSLAGRRGATLKLPPYGSIRLRRLRGGMSQPDAVRATQFSHPTDFSHLNAQINCTAKKANGVVYPYVALGTKLTSYPQFGGRERIETNGPTRAGEVRDIDIDLGPVITLQCVGLDKAKGHFSVSVRLVTDAGEVSITATRLRRSGGFSINLGRAIKGTRLLRFDVDAAEYSSSQACDHALQTTSLDLGKCELVAHGPQLHGYVLDEAGQPVAGARVTMSMQPKGDHAYRQRTDAKGYFASSGPLLRDQDGKPANLYAWARLGRSASEPTQGVASEVTLVMKPGTPSKHKPIATNGSVVVQLTSIHGARDLRTVLKLHGRWGVGRFPTAKPLPDGGTEITFSGLRGGTYRLLANAPDHGKFVVFEELIVPGDGPCTDKRLLGLDFLKHMRKAVVRVVDEQGVPIAGAKITLPDAPRATDGTGSATLYLGRTTKTMGAVQMPGMRTVRRDDWSEGLVVTLEKASNLQIRVKGLPADVARDNIEIWLRDIDSESFEGPRGMLQAKDSVSVPLPARGNYRLRLQVTHRTRGGSTSRTVHMAAETVAIGENKDLNIDYVLDAATVARLRDVLKQPR